VGEDGILQLQVPVGIVNADLAVMIIVQPLPSVTTHQPVAAKTPEELGYSREFLEVLGRYTDHSQRYFLINLWVPKARIRFSTEYNYLIMTPKEIR